MIERVLHLRRQHLKIKIHTTKYLFLNTGWIDCGESTNPHECVKLEEMDRRTNYKVNNSPTRMTSLSDRFKSNKLEMTWNDHLWMRRFKLNCVKLKLHLICDHPDDMTFVDWWSKKMTVNKNSQTTIKKFKLKYTFTV